MTVIGSSSAPPRLSDGLLTATDVCKLLKVSKAFVYRPPMVVIYPASGLAGLFALNLPRS